MRSRRGFGVYDEPKDVLKHISRLQKTEFDDGNSLCCGGSLGNMKINNNQRSLIARDTAAELTKNNPDILATSCPLCKKTLAAATDTKVADIAEIVAEALVLPLLKRNMPEPMIRIKEPINFI